MPVRDTALGREPYEEGWRKGYLEGYLEGYVERYCAEVLRIAAAVLRRRFGDDSRCAAIVAALGDLREEEFVGRLWTAEPSEDAKR